MTNTYKILRFLCFVTLFAGCTIEFIPEIDENKELLVVEGMITDQFRTNTVSLSKSLPLGKPLIRKPVRSAVVTITDEKGVVTTLKEIRTGVYATDSTKFRGRVGGKYALNIKIVNATYTTGFIEMKPVPPITDLNYEKVTFTDPQNPDLVGEGARIYLDTYDPKKECLYFRWDYVETYEYRVPYEVVNKVCWVTERSDKIMIRNTSIYNQSRVSDFIVNTIPNSSDKLKERYSILVNQYSMNESEYDFWQRVQNISQNVGSLYDITPMAIPSNIRSTSNSTETVLGYFSVSAVTQKRLFIKDNFLNLPGFFTYCATDTLYGRLPATGMNVSYWVIEDYGNESPPHWVVTTYRECADCTTRGTNVRPDFWPIYN